MGEEHKIDLGHIQIAGKFHGPKNGLPTIALHGYLDNANSFDTIAPQLHGLRIFAMDFAGHGWSDYRRKGEMYSGRSNMADVISLANKLGWDTFNIIGHSMGAEIGSQLAAFFPDRVNQLICIDGYASTNSAEASMENLKSTLTTYFKPTTNMKVFPDLDAMRERLCKATGQNKTSAECLIERGHKEVEGGYTWITDPRFKGSGPAELSNEQLEILLDNTKAETLLIVAGLDSEWLNRSLDIMNKRNDTNREIVHVTGHHHLHMQEEAEQVSVLINNFLNKQEQQSA